MHNVRCGTSNGKKAALAGLAASLLLAAAPAHAKVVKLPAAKPKIEFDVPDAWTVEPKGANLIVRSPEKNSIIVVGLVKPVKAEVVSWQKAATLSMEEAGISFDKNAKAPPKDPATAFSAIAPAPKTVFSGAPSVAMPESAPAVTTASEDKSMSGMSLEQLTGKAPPDHPQLRFHSVTLFGASLDGKPVDVQFLNFAVTKETAFLMQQQSLPDDSRVNGIVNTVRPAS